MKSPQSWLILLASRVIVPVHYLHQPRLLMLPHLNLGMVSNKMTAIFGHRHFKQKLLQNFIFFVKTFPFPSILAHIWNLIANFQVILLLPKTSERYFVDTYANLNFLLQIDLKMSFIEKKIEINFKFILIFSDKKEPLTVFFLIKASLPIKNLLSFF